MSSLETQHTAKAEVGGARAFALLAERSVGRLADSAGVLEAIRETAEDLFGGRAAGLRFLTQTRELVPVGTTSHGALESLRPIALDDWPTLAAALEERRPTLASDPPRPVRLRSPIAVPLISGKRTLGVLLAESSHGRAPDRDEMGLLHALGEIGGVLLQGALDQERTQRLSDLKGQFIALAAHEIRAPFGVMHGIITTLHHRDDLPADQTATLRQALVEQSDRTTRLIDQLLDLSRLDASTIPIERSRFPIRRRVEDVVRLVAGNRADEVEIQVSEELEVDADPAAFDRILANLVVNALRHGRAPVTVAAQQRDTHLRLTVEDHGRGVDTAFVPRLFERFARNGEAGDAKGSGLGLSIAQSYAQAHGGELVYSHVEPHGARFELVLPRPPQSS